jgi:hypothetical protein
MTRWLSDYQQEHYLIGRLCDAASRWSAIQRINRWHKINFRIMLPPFSPKTEQRA